MTIISNNCSGAALYHDIGMRFDSPTILLQILPSEFPKFCKNLKEYMSYEVKEYTDFSDEHAKEFYDLLGKKPDFPVGKLGDIAILFQHYPTFSWAKMKWNDRKERIDYNHIAYIFVLEKEFKEPAEEFGQLNLKNSLIFTRDFDIEAIHYKYHIEKGMEYLGRSPYTGNRNFCADCDIHKFLRGI